MDYKDGEIYLSGHDRNMIANALLTQIKQITSTRDHCKELGLSGYDFDFVIGNYQYILKRLGEE